MFPVYDVGQCIERDIHPADHSCNEELRTTVNFGTPLSISHCQNQLRFPDPVSTVCWTDQVLASLQQVQLMGGSAFCSSTRGPSFPLTPPQRRKTVYT